MWGEKRTLKKQEMKKVEKIRKKRQMEIGNGSNNWLQWGWQAIDILIAEEK